MRHALALLAALSIPFVTGCDDASPAPNLAADARAPDLGPLVDQGSVDLGPTQRDDGPADAEADAGEQICAQDLDCGERAWCDAGRCTPARATSVAALPADGVTRVGAAAFELTPEAFETWTDRAGPECPSNRAGRFDGRLDVPAPDDPCADGFEDADGDGLLDAVWLGGAGLDRPARAVDNSNPPQARVLVLARDDTVRVVLTLDVHALDAARVAELDRRLRLRLGLGEGELLVHATGNRSGPDAVGLHGPSLALTPGEAGDALRRRLGGRIGLLGALPSAPGISEAWFDMVVARAAAAIERAVGEAAPAQVAAATVDLPLDPDPPTDGAFVIPDADGDGQLNDPADLAAWRARPAWLARDTALPAARDAQLQVLAFRAVVDDRPLAWVLTWGAAPAVIPADQALLSADFPGRVRALLEGEGPGVAVWLTGAAADTVRAGADAWIPAVDDAGQPLGVDGEPVMTLDEAGPAADRLGALATLLATRARAGLAEAAWMPADLSARGRYVWLPLTNPRHGLAARLGLMGPLGDWLSGRTSTRRWASAATTPACGGLGCARYRLERIDLGPVTWITTPGALDGGFARGRGPTQISFGEARALADLDLDGVPDAEDDAIRVQTVGASRASTVELSAPLNPQRFPAATGLTSERIVLIGRVNGGLGSLRDGAVVPQVFEGQLDPLAEFVEAPQNAEIVPCQLGYACQSELTLGELTALTLEAQPEVLADLPGGSELRLVSLGLAMAERVQDWFIEDPEGRLRARGEGLVLGPGDRAFAPGVDLREAGVARDDVLRIDGYREPALTVDGLVPLVLRDHPNAADAWHASSPRGGELVYNTACELVFEGACPHRREPPMADPNESLPRAP